MVAPTYKVLQRATVPTLIESFKGTPLEGRYLENKNLYILPDESRIWCQGADNPGGLEGGQFDAIWGDEAGQFKFSVWIAIQGRTGQKRAPILFTTTPYGRNWLFSDFYNHFRDGDPDYYVRQWSSNKNPAYPEEEYQRAKRTMSPERGAMRYDGEFMQMEGLVYPELYSCIEEELEPKQVVFRPGKFVGGIDFGWNDPFCALGGLLDSDDCLWLWYERYKSETDLDKHASALPKFYGRSFKWYCDSSRPDSIFKLRKGGHKCYKANKRIEEGVDAVHARINSGKLKILRSACPAVIAESQTYHYKEDDEVTIGDKPVDMDNHAMDCLRYLIMGLDRKRAA